MWSCGLTLRAAGALAATLLVNAEQPRFEEASVKRADQCALHNTLDPGMIALDGYPLNVILMTAFAVTTDQIVGPGWLDSECYSIDAKIPDGARKDQVPAMLQALLTERLQLAAHRETKLRAGYALVVDKKGPKFSESDATSPDARARPGVTFGAGIGTAQIKGSMTMASLARFVSLRLGAPVEDLTGLQGKYDIDVSWAPDWSVEKKGRYAQASAADADSTESAAGLSAGPNIFTSFRDSLGLRLESRKVPVEVIVIDHIERVPSPN